MPIVAFRTIDELVALYELEPDIRDLFVEGADDRAVFRWYLSHRCASVVSVQEIDGIEIPASILDRYGVDVGSRGRLLALAEELNVVLRGPARDCVTLVFDSDFDRLQGSARHNEMLLATDYSCLEMYLFNEESLEKMLSLVLHCDLHAKRVLESLGRVLVRLTLIKAANHLLGWGMEWMPFEGQCAVVGDSIEFDEGEFIRRYLIKNHQWDRRVEFDERVQQLEFTIEGDSRHYMNGHHFMDLARWFLRPFLHKAKKPLADKPAFERAFFGCLELQKLDADPLFQKLIRRLSATPG